MHEVSLTESVPKILTLSQGEANELNAIGRRMAASHQILNAASDVDDEDESDRSWIRCEGLGANSYRVTVSNAVGVIGLPNLQLTVGPKIPPSHLRYLMSFSIPAATSDVGSAGAEADADLWDLVARWFVSSTEALLRRGLLSDYDEQADELTFARGSIRALPTARAYYQGRLVLYCDYDEFSEDSALNRVIRAALVAVAATPAIDDLLRKRAIVAKAKMPDVGSLRPSDVRSQLDRRTWFYDDAFQLALHVLASTGRTFTSGGQKAWTFLVRTPWLVEAALREVLQSGMKGICAVKKTSVPIPPTTLSLRPDLVFGSVAVGDVKYKIAKAQWNRPDLYQIVAFASGFKVRFGLLVSFTEDPAVTLPDLVIGDVRVHSVLWDCSQPDPECARDVLVQSGIEWLAMAGVQG